MLKMREIWLAAGDENSKFFQNYAKGRKNTNMIWGLKMTEGGITNSFSDLATMGRNHFNNLFKDPEVVSIEEVIQVSQLFPRYAEEEENDMLMALVSKGEVEGVLKAL